MRTCGCSCSAARAAKRSSSGTDIGQFTGFSTRDDVVGYEARLDAVIDRLERVRAATIAQIEGVAAGGGCAIAIACDLRVCTPESRFGVPVARTLGNCLSAANYARLRDLVGPARVKDLMFTGRLVDGHEAAAIGLVTRVVERACNRRSGPRASPRRSPGMRR